MAPILSLEPAGSRKNFPHPESVISSQRVYKGQMVTFTCVSFLKEDGISEDNPENDELLTMEAGAKGPNPFATFLGKCLIGMRQNETKQFNVPRGYAFGPVYKDRIFKLPLKKGHGTSLGDDIKIKISGSDREEFADGVVVKIDKDVAHVDTNHPLAGKSILIRIKIADFVNKRPQNH